MPGVHSLEGEPAAVLVRLGERGPALADPFAPFLRADDVGVLRGDGVFERFLVQDGHPRHLEEHLARMDRSARMTDLALPGRAAWASAIGTALSHWRGGREWAMRLVCTRGPEGSGPPTAYVLGQELSAEVLHQRREGVAVVTIARGLPAGLAADAPWLLLGTKTLSYAVNVATKRWARAQGADEAIFIGTGGEVWEAGTSAVVAAFGRQLVSPPASLGILDSISVARLFAAARASGWGTRREHMHLDALFSADGLWLSSSLRFSRVHTLDGKGLARPSAHEELSELAAVS